jgi:hypothetical protein
MNPARLDALRARHAELERRLASELARPATCIFTVTALKRQKLQLKDSIARLDHFSF